MDVRRLRTLVALLALAIMASTASFLPAAASVPQPVVAIPSDGEDAAPEEPPPPAEPPPPEAWEQPAYICSDDVIGVGGGSSLATATAEILGSGGHPAPVVAVDGPGAGTPPSPPVVDCKTYVRLELTIRAPAGQRPEGVDATLNDISVPQWALEGGFEIDLPPESHRVSLADPGPDWDLTETFCVCTSATGSTGLAGAALTGRTFAFGSLALSGYPGPVVAVGGAQQESMGCGGAAASSDASTVSTSSSVATTAPAPRGGFGTSSATTAAPQPVVAVDPEPSGIDLDIDPAPTMSWSADGGVSIQDSYRVGGVFLCEWVLEWAYGDLIIETVTEPPGEEDRFSYRVTPSFSDPPAGPVSIAGTGGGAPAEIRKGRWAIDVQGLADGWGVTESSCTETDGTTPSSAAGPVGTAGIDAMDAVRCRFEFGLITLREGRWVAVNRPGVFACPGAKGIPGLSLPGSTQRGSITLRQGGKVLVGSGLSEGGTIRLRRDPGNPLRYRGRVNIPGGGARLEFRVTLQVRSETSARADLKATFRFAGVSCTATRRVDLTHASAR